MQPLTISIIQTDLFWQDRDRNRDHFTGLIESIEGPTDLIILPEMFTSGFTMDAAANAESMDGESVSWMKAMAASTKSAVCGSMIIEVDGFFFNRFIVATSDGELRHYDKKHLFRLASEHQHYKPGCERVVFELNGFRICPMVCYDLRFPVWSRSRGDYDLLLYVANWPSRRQFAWDTLLRARAIENLSFAAGVNRVGIDGNELPYTGGSAVVDYLGADIANLRDLPGIATATLDRQALVEFRNRFAFHEDADAFSLA